MYNYIVTLRNSKQISIYANSMDQAWIEACNLKHSKYGGDRGYNPATVEYFR